MNALPLQYTIDEVFSWEQEGLALKVWNVTLAKYVLSKLGEKGAKMQVDLSMEMVRTSLSFNYDKRDADRIARADWRIPIIAVTIWNPKTNREEALVIDGWHRMDKYVLDNPPEPMKCYWFDRVGSDMLLIGGGQ